MFNKLNITCLFVIAGICIYLISAFVGESTPSDLDPTKPKSVDSNIQTPDSTPEINTQSSPSIVDTTNTDPRFIRFTDGTVHFLQSFTTSRSLHQNTEPEADLEIVSQLLADYRLVYKENPVGTDNAEIVGQLLGDNPKKTFFIDPKLSALNSNGELLDRWGSPYVFHPLKSDLMDVRSLGPDRKLWTEDDLSLDLKGTEDELLLHPTP